MVWCTHTAVAPESPYAIGYSRMEGGVSDRTVSIIFGIGMFTEWRRRFRYCGF